MFAIRGSILHSFMDNYPEFFTTSLNKFETGRWFIELELCNIVPTRMGYYPATIELGDWAKGESLKPFTDTWIQKNKLNHLEDYYNLVRL